MPAQYGRLYRVESGDQAVNSLSKHLIRVFPFLTLDRINVVHLHQLVVFTCSNLTCLSCLIARMNTFKAGLLQWRTLSQQL